MQVITKALKVGRVGYYEKHLLILNVILPESQFPLKLKPKEIEVLATFMAQDKNIIEDDMFNVLSRKKVMQALKMKPGGLGNHLKSMLDKNYLERHPVTKKLSLKKYLFPVDNGQGYRVKLIKNI